MNSKRKLKNVKIISKARAMKILNALKNKGIKAWISKYCTGKYSTDVKTGSDTKILGYTYCVFRELRYDNDGPYVCIRAVSTY